MEPGLRVAYAYDPAGSPVKDEDAPLWRDPPAQFGPEVAALVEQERRVTWAGGLVLRLGHLYGPGSSFAPDGAFARRLRDGKVPLVGDGGAMFSFTHAHDAATAILAAVEHPIAGGVLNVVDDQPTLVRDWLPEMAAMLGAPAPRHVPAWPAPPTFAPANGWTGSPPTAAGETAWPPISAYGLPDEKGSQVVTAYTGHRDVAMLQSLC